MKVFNPEIDVDPKDWILHQCLHQDSAKAVLSEENHQIVELLNSHDGKVKLLVKELSRQTDCVTKEYVVKLTELRDLVLPPVDNPRIEVLVNVHTSQGAMALLHSESRSVKEILEVTEVKEKIQELSSSELSISKRYGLYRELAVLLNFQVGHPRFH